MLEADIKLLLKAEPKAPWPCLLRLLLRIMRKETVTASNGNSDQYNRYSRSDLPGSDFAQHRGSEVNRTMQ